MNDPKPTATITINGQQYTMTFDFNAMAIIQEETGKNPFGDELWQNLGPVETIAMLYGFLNTYHPDITKKWLRQNIHLGNMKEIIETMQEAWMKAIPETDETEETDQEEKKINHSSNG